MPNWSSKRKRRQMIHIMTNRSIPRPHGSSVNLWLHFCSAKEETSWRRLFSYIHVCTHTDNFPFLQVFWWLTYLTVTFHSQILSAAGFERTTNTRSYTFFLHSGHHFKTSHLTNLGTSIKLAFELMPPLVLNFLEVNYLTILQIVSHILIS